MSYRIHRVGVADWPRVRTLRLAALRDAPLAFGERYEDAVVAPDEMWRGRAERAAGPTAVQVIAVTETGEWVGMMTSLLDDGADGSRRALIVGVWVHPDHRGRTAGAAQLLLDTVIEWARDEAKIDHLDLDVTETNTRAIAFYRRNGFVLTGDRHPYDNDASLCELVMTRDLS